MCILSCIEMNKPTQMETSAPATWFPLGPRAAVKSDLLLINPSKQLSWQQFGKS